MGEQWPFPDHLEPLPVLSHLLDAVDLGDPRKVVSSAVNRTRTPPPCRSTSSPGDVRTDIRDRLEGLGPEADTYRRWVEWVDETGEDPPGKAAQAVLRLIADSDTNGSFVSVEDPLQAPIPSWEDPYDDRPWES